MIYETCTYHFLPGKLRPLRQDPLTTWDRFDIRQAGFWIAITN